MNLKLEAWKAISKFVRQRDSKCVTCGRVDNWKNLDCGHYIPNTERSKGLGGNELWYDLRNLNAQCGGCNRWGHGNLTKYADYLENKYGYGILQELRRLYKIRKVWTKKELEALIQKYKVV